jgi:4'-phosphopantetheinyl transferase
MGLRGRELTSDVHVWRLSLDLSDDRLASFASVLTESERLRAAAFVLERDRRAFVATRGALRRLLSAYLGGPAPSEIRLAIGAHGKPHLVDNAVRFNVSHSGTLALLAFSRTREVGIDVERHRPIANVQALASDVFSAAELDALARVGCDAQSQREAFFRCWSRKEAFIKATGLGLAQPLEDFDVTLAPDDARLLDVRTRHGAPGPRRWCMRDLPIDSGYSAAIVVESEDAFSLRRYSVRFAQRGGVILRNEAARRRGAESPLASRDQRDR